FAPNTRLKPCGNVSSPALTSPMVLMVVALDDCTRSVTTAPQKVPLSDVAAAFASTVRRAVPARAFRPSVITAMPRRKKPIPPKMVIGVSKAASSIRRTAVQAPVSVNLIRFYAGQSKSVCGVAYDGACRSDRMPGGSPRLPDYQGVTGHLRNDLSGH